MEKFIRIDGREVPFRATAAVPRLYRIKFGRDIMQDMRDLQAAIEKSESGEQPIPVKLLEVFENAAYLMARHADPDMKEHSVEEWLDTFGTFSIYEAVSYTHLDVYKRQPVYQPKTITPPKEEE